ncbi:glycosyltransferase family 4 protein [Paracoccus sp. 11-3]|uniref:Glycosyltransferase family 4 protein n=1 Tax=Paracoccus amoyensis TaxID=2760093 RepID=A0A926JE43_9RHOB|nr:glycosyltransferase family 4 protein [Paracoccus amoyensis]MBC9247778.1 glycosyltransferase family 4 protein [Paracoccus amoyensis]
MADRSSSKWLIVAPFFKNRQDRWLDDFIIDPSLAFKKIAPPRKPQSWHQRRSKLTSVSEWWTHLLHSRQAIKKRPAGIVTCFPQLAMCAALWKKISRHKTILIAYNYNLGELRPGARQRLARLTAKEIDCYIVHSPQEVKSYAEYLSVPESRVHFIPLQRGALEIQRKEDTKDPYMIAMGSAKRDYALLIKAADRLNIPTIIVTREDDVRRLPKSTYVRFMSNLSETQCHQLLARARISVTPIENDQTASGQITFLNAMQLGVPVIATNCPGTDGYIEHQKNGILVEPGDVHDMSSAIGNLWRDETAREKLAANAQRIYRDRFSDSAAARSLHAIIRRLSAGRAAS